VLGRGGGVVVPWMWGIGGVGGYVAPVLLAIRVAVRIVRLRSEGERIGGRVLCVEFVDGFAVFVARW